MYILEGPSIVHRCLYVYMYLLNRIKITAIRGIEGGWMKGLNH
jgi:hypothetical protein